MKAVVQRVTEAHVTVDEGQPGEARRSVGALDEPGLLVYVGVHTGDTTDNAARMARKLHELRVLRGEESCASSGAPLLIVSQFTLYGDTRKGRRPSYSAAAAPEQAAPLVEALISELRGRGARVATGEFAAMMHVHSVNDGPYTVLVET